MPADPTNTHLAAIPLIFRAPRWKTPEHVRVFQTELIGSAVSDSPCSGIMQESSMWTTLCHRILLSPYGEGDIPHAQATAPTSGQKLIFEVALGARRPLCLGPAARSRSHLFRRQGTASL